MGLENFIPSEVMTEAILFKLRKQLVAADAVNNSYRGILTQYGSSVKIPTFETAGASDYTENQTLTYNALDSASQILSIDQQKYFAYKVDYIDDRQSAAVITTNVLDQATADLQEAADTYLLQTVFEDAGVVGGSGARALGTSGSAVSVNAEASGCLQYVGRLQQRLDEENVPQANRWIICPPWFHSQLVQLKAIETMDIPTFDNGRVGRCLGFDVRVSSNLVNATTSASEIFAGISSAVEFVDYVVESEIRELEQTFGFGIRGLYVYGAKTVRSKALAKGVITQAV